MTSPNPAVPRRRSRLLVASVAGIALVLTAAAVMLFLANQEPTGNVPSHGSSVQSVGGSSPQPQQLATPPTSVPSGVTWSLVGQTAVPVSAMDGPVRISGCQASGYSRTPIGALIAAAQISTRAGFYAGRSCWEPTISNQLVPSADRDALLAQLKSAESSGVPAAASGTLAQIVGFRFTSYTTDTAVIGLVRRSPQGRLAQTTLTVVWTEDAADWRLVAPPSGQWTAVTSTDLSNLDGIVPWAAD